MRLRTTLDGARFDAIRSMPHAMSRQVLAADFHQRRLLGRKR
jgi:hypothetical protein